MNGILKWCAKWEPCFETMNIVANDGHGLDFYFYKKCYFKLKFELKKWLWFYEMPIIINKWQNVGQWCKHFVDNDEGVAHLYDAKDQLCWCKSGRVMHKA